jgi:RNA polymerase-binding transcription factor DksA
MTKDNRTKEQLNKRRDEILNQLSRTEKDLRIELDRDPEEQALQIEQDEVSIRMESNLRKELIEIEDQLAELEGQG